MIILVILALVMLLGCLIWYDTENIKLENELTEVTAERDALRKEMQRRGHENTGSL